MKDYITKCTKFKKGIRSSSRFFETTTYMNVITNVNGQNGFKITRELSTIIG